MSVDCNNPVSGEEQQLCSCLESTRSLQRMLDTYDVAMKRYNEEEDQYIQFVKDWQDWNANTGKFSRFADRVQALTDEKKIWNNCVMYHQADAGDNHGYCSNDFGSGWYHTGKADKECTSGMAKGICQRSNDEVNRIVNGEKAPYEPEAVPQPRQPAAPSDLTIQCCANIINAAGADLRDVAQSCQQRIGEKMSEDRNASTSDTFIERVKRNWVIVTGTSVFLCIVLSLFILLAFW